MNVSSTAARSSKGFTTLSCRIELRTTAPQIAAVCNSNTGSRRQSGKRTILKHFLEGILKGNENHHCQTRKNVLPKHHSRVSRCHHNAIYNSQLQNAMVLRMQLQQRGSLTQPRHCDLRTLSCKTQKNCARRLHKLQRLATPKPDLDAKAERGRF